MPSTLAGAATNPICQMEKRRYAWALEAAPAVTSPPSGQERSFLGFTTRRVPARPLLQGCPRPGRLQARARRNAASPGEGAGRLAAARRPGSLTRLGDSR